MVGYGRIFCNRPRSRALHSAFRPLPSPLFALPSALCPRQEANHFCTFSAPFCAFFDGFFWSIVVHQPVTIRNCAIPIWSAATRRRFPYGPTPTPRFPVLFLCSGDGFPL